MIDTFEQLKRKLAENEANPLTGGKDSEINKVSRELAEAYARQVGFGSLEEATGPAPRELIINEETQAIYNRLKKLQGNPLNSPLFFKQKSTPKAS